MRRAGDAKGTKGAFRRKTQEMKTPKVENKKISGSIERGNLRMFSRTETRTDHHKDNKITRSIQIILVITYKY